MIPHTRQARPARQSRRLSGTSPAPNRKTWWHHQMETFSALLAFCAGNSPVTDEFPAQRPVTRSFDVCFDLRLNKRLSKQSWGGLSDALWRHCNDILPRVPYCWTFFHRYPHSVEISFCSHHDSSRTVARKVYPWHESCAVKAWVTNWWDQIMASTWITAKRSFHWIWIASKNRQWNRPCFNIDTAFPCIWIPIMKIQRLWF